MITMMIFLMKTSMKKMKIRARMNMLEEGKRNVRKSNIIQKSVSVKNRRREYPDKEGRAPKRRKFPLISNLGEVEQECEKEEHVNIDGSSMTVDSLSCQMDGPSTNPGDTALSKVNPIIAKGKSEEDGADDCTGSSSNDWRPCRLEDDPRLGSEDTVQSQSAILSDSIQMSLNKDDIRWYFNSDSKGGGGEYVSIEGDGGGGGSYEENDGGGDYVKYDGGGGYVDNENDSVNMNADVMSTIENEPDLVSTSVDEASTSEERKVNPSKSMNVNDSSEECVLVDKKSWCNTHSCLVSKVTVTSKKWQWIKRKKCYGNVSSKVNKYLCKNKNSGRVDAEVPLTNLNMADRIKRAQSEEEGKGSSYVVRHVGSQSKERESGLMDGDYKSLTGNTGLNPLG